MNILKEANSIVNERSEEKERMYGPFSEGMERAAMIMRGMTGKDYTAEDMYAALVALKLSRHSYNYKEDNLLDAVAYLGALNNYCLDKLNLETNDSSIKDQQIDQRDPRRVTFSDAKLDRKSREVYKAKNPK